MAMLEKILLIQNVGKFSQFNIRKDDWDGSFSKVNILYAPNGSGKTTFSLIFQSLKNDAALLQKKSTFADLQVSGPEQIVKLRIDGRTVEFRNNSWTEQFENVEVFNVHFIENTLFTGSIQLTRNQHNLFTYLSGQEGAARKEKLLHLRKQRIEIGKKVRATKNLFKKGLIPKYQKDTEIERCRDLREPITREMRALNEEMGLFAQRIFQEFTEKVNTYLSKFSRSMRLEKISKELDQRTTFYLQFGKNRVTFDQKQNGHEFRYTLSEGDKNALAFSVFLARLSFSPILEKLIIVFDDPLTSLDSGRRYLTIRELLTLSQVVGQIFVLTHDASFSADLEREVRESSLSLELASNSNITWLRRRDHQGEHLTGLFRDLKTLTEFKKRGAQDESMRRDVLRCLRPTLEGFIRVKYFDRISKTQWLGDFIEAIRKAPSGDDLERLRHGLVLNELCEINDYSKRAHHSSPHEPESKIEEDELHVMVGKTLALLKML